MYLLRLRQADIARRYKLRAPRQPTATRWKAWPGPKLLCFPTPQYFFFCPLQCWRVFHSNGSHLWNCFRQESYKSKNSRSHNNGHISRVKSRLWHGHRARDMLHIYASFDDVSGWIARSDCSVSKALHRKKSEKNTDHFKY